MVNIKIIILVKISKLKAKSVHILYSAYTGLFISPSGISGTRLRNNQDRHGRKEHINR